MAYPVETTPPGPRPEVPAEHAVAGS